MRCKLLMRLLPRLSGEALDELPVHSYGSRQEVRISARAMIRQLIASANIPAPDDSSHPIDLSEESLLPVPHSPLRRWL